MAFISEIHYRTGDVVAGNPATHEYVEITLGPGEDPADFVVGFYGTTGNLMTGSGIQATGVSNGQVTLSSLVGVPDPQNFGYMIYTITSNVAPYELVNASSSQVSDEANYVALTNTATSTTQAIGIGANGSETLSGGAANGSGTTNVAKVGSGQSVQFDYLGNNISGPWTPGNAEVPCFCAGTWITVPGGLRRVEELAAGDEVMTLDHGPQRIRWIGERTLNAAELAASPKLRPVHILQGSLGQGQPERDLDVSRQHRMVVSSQIAKRMLGVSRSLVSAIRLTALPGIYVDVVATDVRYFHLLFDRHEIIFAEGAPTESLYLGERALQAIGDAARDEICTLFPEFASGKWQATPAAHLPTNVQQKRLVGVHARNRMDVLDRALA